MRNKKSDEPQKTPEELALEQKVDAMMDPKKPDKAPVEAAPPPSAEKPETPAPDAPGAGADAKTAPQLSDKLSKQIAAAEVPTKPLSIDKLSEVTETIDEPEPRTKQEKPKTPKPSESENADEPAGQDDVTDHSAELDDSRTEKAVDDIVAHEGDVMLAVEDATAAERNRKAGEASGEKTEHHPFRAFFWLLVIIVVIVAIAFFGFLFTGGNLPKIPKL